MLLQELLNKDLLDVRFLTNEEMVMLGWEDKPNTIVIVIDGVALIPVAYNDPALPISKNIPAGYEFDYNEEIVYPTNIGLLENQ